LPGSRKKRAGPTAVFSGITFLKFVVELSGEERGRLSELISKR
jgi:hypothetical protein